MKRECYYCGRFAEAVWYKEVKSWLCERCKHVAKGDDGIEVMVLDKDTFDAEALFSFIKKGVGE